MRKISFWINTGFAGCNYEETMEFDDSITDEQLDEEAKIFLTNNIDFGWFEVQNDKNKYEKWAKDLMDEIEKIAEEKYPDVPYWLATGNRYQCCMEMLAHFRKDL